MERKRALISKRAIFRAVGLVNVLRSKRLTKIGALLELAKRDGVVYQKTEENGVIRIRMMVKRCDLEKLVGYDDDVSVPSLVEQRLRQLRRKHHAKVVDNKKGSSWTPALRSIPEDF